MVTSAELNTSVVRWALERSVNGDADLHCGAEMKGGKITVNGDAELCWP